MSAGGAGRRWRGAPGGLALVAVVALVIASLGSSAGAASTACTWQRHAKRVVTHVKRHGKVTKVVRIKHYWTCKALPTPETTPPVQQPPVTPTPVPTPTPPTETQPEPKANAIAVVADDENAQGMFSYRVLAEEPRTGPLTLQLQNDGEDPHNLNIEAVGPGGPEGGPVAEIENTAPGGQQSKVVELPPGEYRMFCSIGHHAEHGMEARIVIK